MSTFMDHRLTRRTFVKSAGASTAIAATLLASSSSSAQEATPTASSGLDWGRFDTSIETAQSTFDMVGVAVSVVVGDEIAYRRMFGVRDLETGTPVTPETHFLVASTTKSMTSLLVATYVDEGVLDWDQRVREVFPDFRAPTAELTDTLRVRDMLNMSSGIGEPDAVSAFHQGDPTTPQLLQMLSGLPVIGAPGDQFFYNGTVYSVGGYLPALALGVDPFEIGSTYASQMSERVYGPTGMTSARIADDPRPFTTEYATGYGPDFSHGTARQPFAPVGSYAPAGGTLATHDEMTRYVMMQLNRGVANDGTRVVSEKNLAECWASNVDVPFDTETNPDLVRSGYGMGWLDFTYRGGRRLVSHAGGVDGFTTFLALLPDDGIGLVVNTNVGPLARGLGYVQYVSALLVETLYGLNIGAADVAVSQYRAAAQGLTDLATVATPADEAKIAAWIGFYERGWSLGFDDVGTLLLRQSSRAIPILALPDGSYVMASGVAPGAVVQFVTDASGMPAMEIVGLETVRWMTGESP